MSMQKSMAIAGVDKVKAAATPFVPESSILAQDEASRGELAPHAPTL